MRILATAKRIALVALFVLPVASRCTAQSSPTADGKDGGVDWYESFEGSTDPSGQVMALTSSATYHFGSHFGIGAGIPLYFIRSTATSGTTTSEGIGDFFVTLGASWKKPVLNYGTTITGTASTGNSTKGLSTGHATFDWNNRVDHDFGLLTPFLDAGVGDTISDSTFFHRPFTSYGYLAHFEGGTDVDLSHSFSLTLSAYDIAPWGTQTIVSRSVPQGAAGNGGQHGRVFEVNHTTTGAASINQDDGFTAGLSFNPKPYLDLDAGYTHSTKFAFNSLSWGVGVNLSTLLRGKNAAR